MKLETQTATTSTFSLTPVNLNELGLQEADIAEVNQVAQRIQPNNPITVSEFGRDVAEHTSRYADSLLDQVRNRDLDEAGAKLGQVVNIARTLNMGPLSDKRSRVPVVGALIDKFRLRTTNELAAYGAPKSPDAVAYRDKSLSRQRWAEIGTLIFAGFSAAVGGLSFGFMMLRQSITRRVRRIHDLLAS